MRDNEMIASFLLFFLEKEKKKVSAAAGGNWARFGKLQSNGRVGPRKSRVSAEPGEELPGSRGCLDLSALHSVKLLALLRFTPPSWVPHTPPPPPASRAFLFTLGSTLPMPCA